MPKGDRTPLTEDERDGIILAVKSAFRKLKNLKTKGVISSFVFHQANGKQIKDFRKSWKSACEDAGYPNKLVHDFRRTAVRNLERARVPRSTAMKMTGHKTESVYTRYAIVDELMLQEGAAKLDAWSNAQRALAAAAKPKGQLKTFAKRRAR
jgi:integrase